MLDVSQGHVAEYLGIAANTLSKIESGQSDVSGTRLTDIQRFYEREGVEFTENDGVKRNLNPIFFIETDTHEETYLKILEDVSEQLKGHKNPELLIMYSDDKVSSKKVNDKYRQMRNEGIKMRQLIEEGNTYMMGPLEEYRYIKKGFFINRVTLVYGDRIANETSNVLRASIRVDPINAEIQRNTFNMLWSILEQPVGSTSNERF